MSQDNNQGKTTSNSSKFLFGRPEPSFSFSNPSESFDSLSNLSNQFNNLNTNPNISQPLTFPLSGSFSSVSSDQQHQEIKPANSANILAFPRFKPRAERPEYSFGGEMIFMSITAMNEYKEKSFEEWRWLFILASQGKLNYDPFKSSTNLNVFGSRLNDDTKSSTNVFNNHNSSNLNATNSNQNSFKVKEGTVTSSTSDISNSNSSGSSCFGSAVQINSGYIEFPNQDFNLCDSEFSDLIIEIHDNDQLFGSIRTHRLLVGGRSKPLSNLIKSHSIIRNDQAVVELNTSTFDSRFGKVTGSILYTAINSIITTVHIHVNDFIPVFLILDYYHVPTKHLTKYLNDAINISESVARSFIKNFGTANRYFSVSHAENVQTLFTLFRAAFRVLMNGKDIENMGIFKTMSRDMFVDGLIHCECKEEATLLQIMDYWLGENTEAENLMDQVCELLNFTQIAEPVVMIQYLSSYPSPYHFINNLGSLSKLQLIQKYILLATDQSHTRSDYRRRLKKEINK